MAFTTFRNRKTGLIGQYPAEFGVAFDYLEEVDEDAKPLAFVPLEVPAADEDGFTDPDTGFADSTEDPTTALAKTEGKAK